VVTALANLDMFVLSKTTGYLVVGGEMVAWHLDLYTIRSLSVYCFYFTVISFSNISN
jgi:hypothetical protein